MDTLHVISHSWAYSSASPKRVDVVSLCKNSFHRDTILIITIVDIVEDVCGLYEL